jgi:hypothetical protein
MTEIVTTRFNNSTWEENCRFRERKQLGCVYGLPRPITQKIPLNSLVFVVEMNNSTNNIEGIGLVRNILRSEKKQRVYQSDNFNLYSYQGKYRLSRSVLQEKCPKILQILEQLVFTGKTHLKRGTGFTRISEKHYEIHKILENYQYTEKHIKTDLSICFNDHFSKQIIT